MERLFKRISDCYSTLNSRNIIPPILLGTTFLLALKTKAPAATVLAKGASSIFKLGTRDQSSKEVSESITYLPPFAGIYTPFLIKQGANTLKNLKLNY